MKYRVGVDVGGTFTDLVSIDEEGKVKVVKTPSTPEDPSIGIENAIIKAGLNLHDVTFFSHGATIGINTVIQNKGVRTAIVTTKRFRDIIELRRGQRVINNPTDMYNLQMDLPQDYVGGYSPLVERPLRFEVSERVDYQGGAGSSMEKVVKTFMLLKRLEDYPRMRKTEVEYYQKHAPHLVDNPPVSTIMQLSSMTNPEALFEIDVTAVH